jgi:hypothetical protein
MTIEEKKARLDAVLAAMPDEDRRSHLDAECVYACDACDEAQRLYGNDPAGPAVLAVLAEIAAIPYPGGKP